MHYGNKNGLLPWNGMQFLQIKIKTPAQRMLSTFHNAFPCALYEAFWKAVAACCGVLVTGMAHVCSDKPTGERVLQRSQISTWMRPPLLIFCSAVVNCFPSVFTIIAVISCWDYVWWNTIFLTNQSPTPVFLGYLGKVAGIKHLR